MVNLKNPELDGSFENVSPLRGFVVQAGEVASNAIELAELQLKLVKADAAKAVTQSVAPMIMVALSIGLLFASLLLLLFGVAHWIEYAFELPTFAAQLIVGGSGIVIALCVVAVAHSSLKQKSSPFQRSSNELAQNISWLKTIFQNAN